MDKPGHIYLLKANGLHKIGRSKDVDRRMGQIQPKLPYASELVLSAKVADAAAAERMLHERFADRRVRGEWFSLNDIDLNWVKRWADPTKSLPRRYKMNRNQKPTGIKIQAGDVLYIAFLVGCLAVAVFALWKPDLGGLAGGNNRPQPEPWAGLLALGRGR